MNIFDIFIQVPNGNKYIWYSYLFRLLDTNIFNIRILLTVKIWVNSISVFGNIFLGIYSYSYSVKILIFVLHWFPACINVIEMKLQKLTKVKDIWKCNFLPIWWAEGLLWCLNCLCSAVQGRDKRVCAEMRQSVQTHHSLHHHTSD